MPPAALIAAHSLPVLSRIWLCDGLAPPFTLFILLMSNESRFSLLTRGCQKYMETEGRE
jgi:hypothetical protein